MALNNIYIINNFYHKHNCNFALHQRCVGKFYDLCRYRWILQFQERLKVDTVWSVCTANMHESMFNGYNWANYFLKALLMPNTDFIKTFYYTIKDSIGHKRIFNKFLCPIILFSWTYIYVDESIMPKQSLFAPKSLHLSLKMGIFTFFIHLMPKNLSPGLYSKKTSWHIFHYGISWNCIASQSC